MYRIYISILLHMSCHTLCALHYAMVECCFPFLFRCFVLAVECDSEVKIDNTEGLCWIIGDQIKQKLWRTYSWLSRSTQAEDFQKRYILLSKSKASITSYLHI